MPKLVYRPKTGIPEAVRKLKTFSPDKIREHILARYNKSVTRQSVSMWFSRHPDVRAELEKELLAKELNQEEVAHSLYTNGAFEKLPSVQTWIRGMRRRRLRERTISDWVSGLKRICQGVVSVQKGWDLSEFGWVLKSPDRLTMDDCIEFTDLVYEHYPKGDMARMSRIMRGFLTSKGEVVGKKIPAPESKGAREMADLFVERPVLEKMLLWTKAKHGREAYLLNKFLFKTASRIEAALKALASNLKPENGHAEIRVYDKGSGSKYPEGRPWDKYIPPGLAKELVEYLAEREEESDLLFPSFNSRTMAEINREALAEFCPWVLEKYPQVMPNHFWRHMFAQHMLRKTGWNYSVVAALGGWSVSALERNYGKPPQEKIKEWGIEQVPDL